MKALFVVGLAVVVLGILSFFVALPQQVGNDAFGPYAIRWQVQAGDLVRDYFEQINSLLFSRRRRLIIW